MSLVYIGLYTIFVVIIWGFFAVARIHAHKFKNFSSQITKATTILFFFLVFLTISGYVIVLSMGDYNFKAEINTVSPDVIQEESY